MTDKSDVYVSSCQLHLSALPVESQVFQELNYMYRDADVGSMDDQDLSCIGNKYFADKHLHDTGYMPTKRVNIHPTTPKAFIPSRNPNISTYYDLMDDPPI